MMLVGMVCNGKIQTAAKEELLEDKLLEGESGWFQDMVE